MAFVVLFVINKSYANGYKTDTLIHQEWYGNWVGLFESTLGDVPKERINIRITAINKNFIVEGEVIRAEIKRRITGTFYEKTQTFSLNEFVADKPTATFVFSIRKDTLKGNWTTSPIDKYGNQRRFTLIKKQFVYNPKLMLPELWYKYSDFLNQKGFTKTPKGMQSSYRQSSNIVLQLNSSTSELKEANLKNLKKIDLEIIRLTIYARHGFIFKDTTTRQYFENVDWYVPLYDNVDSQLTALEIKNIALLKRFETYAKENYNTFYR